MAKLALINCELDTAKIIADTPDELVVPVIVTREGVVNYPHGRAYRSAQELARSWETFEHSPIVEGRHPKDMLVTNPDQIVGYVTNVKFEADAVDPLGRKSAAIIGEAHIRKKKASAKFLADAAKGTQTQVSSGFIKDEVPSAGTWNGERYDFVQKDIIGNHLAAGVLNARVKPPFIGLNVDAIDVELDEPAPPQPPTPEPNPTITFPATTLATDTLIEKHRQYVR